MVIKLPGLQPSGAFLSLSLRIVPVLLLCFILSCEKTISLSAVSHLPGHLAFKRPSVSCCYLCNSFISKNISPGCQHSLTFQVLLELKRGGDFYLLDMLIIKYYIQLCLPHFKKDAGEFHWIRKVTKSHLRAVGDMFLGNVQGAEGVQHIKRKIKRYDYSV